MSEGWAVVPKSDAEAIERNNAKLFQYITPARVNTETLWFATAATEPGAATPPHTHTSETVAMVLRGRARFRIGAQLENVVDLGPGDVIYVAAGIVHVEETLGDETVEFVAARDKHGGETVPVEVLQTESKNDPGA